MRWALLVALAVSVAVGSWAVADSAAGLTARATKLYRKKKYDEACQLFRKVTELVPTSASAWADLGLCLGKLPGSEADAVAANRKALALGKDSEKIRKAALFNLGKLEGSEVPSHVPGPTEDLLRDLEGLTPTCKIFDPPPGCAKPVWGCSSGPGWSNLLQAGARSAVDRAQAVSECGILHGRPGRAETVLDGDVVLRAGTYIAQTVEGDSCDHQELRCRVVWADACAARAGIACTVTWDRQAVSDLYETGDEEPCPAGDIVVGELSLR